MKRGNSCASNPAGATMRVANVGPVASVACFVERFRLGTAGNR